MNTKQLARRGVFYLQEAVMDIMVQNQNSGMTASDIGKALSLFRGTTLNDGYVWNALKELESYKLVRHQKKQTGRGGAWFLTDETYKRRTVGV